MTRLIFIRHGLSAANLTRTFAGHTDVPLSDAGALQAGKIADRLENEPLTRIYASPLLRAMRTAEPTAKAHGLPIRTDDGWMEIAAGKWEGMKIDDIASRFPNSYSVWRTDLGRMRPDGGESFLELADRVRAAMDRIVSGNSDGCVAVFTHATPIRAVACICSGTPLAEANRFPIPGNASLTIAEYTEKGGYRLLCFDSRDHL